MVLRFPENSCSSLPVKLPVPLSIHPPRCHTKNVTPTDAIRLDFLSFLGPHKDQIFLEKTKVAHPTVCCLLNDFMVVYILLVWKRLYLCIRLPNPIVSGWTSCWRFQLVVECKQDVRLLWSTVYPLTKGISPPSTVCLSQEGRSQKGKKHLSQTKSQAGHFRTNTPNTSDRSMSKIHLLDNQHGLFPVLLFGARANHCTVGTEIW